MSPPGPGSGIGAGLASGVKERNPDTETFTADLELLLRESDREDPILPEIRNADQAPEEELNERILAGLVSP